ncbi:MAG TPA: hypothetical protein VMZ30_17615 [Pyrinomonadaceae bacterium]|nr:hypothetical protein [Pyrinomonadaceae bacterium]
MNSNISTFGYPSVCNLLAHDVPLLDINQCLPKHDHKQKSIYANLHPLSAGYALPTSIGLVLTGFGVLYWAFWLLYVRVISGGRGWWANAGLCLAAFLLGSILTLLGLNRDKK